MIGTLSRVCSFLFPETKVQKDGKLYYPTVYVKGYYGYKNFGDELLALGVLTYLEKHYSIDVLYIEVDNIDWFWTWLRRHEEIISFPLSKVKLINRRSKFWIFWNIILSKHVHIFLGGGEVFTESRGRFYGGGNMALLFFSHLLRHKLTLMGGVSKAKTALFSYIHRFFLSMSVHVVLRDRGSYDYAVKNSINPNRIILYQDFGLTYIDSLSLSTLTILTSKISASITCLGCPYLIVNYAPYCDWDEFVKSVIKATSFDSYEQIVYISGGVEDKIYYSRLLDFFPGHKLTHIDWTRLDIFSLIYLFSRAHRGVGVRLHVLSMFVWFGVPFYYIPYQEKILKFVNNSNVEEIENGFLKAKKFLPFSVK